MRPKTHLLALSALTLILLVAGNISLQGLLPGLRIDFTSGRLYTLSDATKDTLERLSEPVELTLVYSRRSGQDYPSIHAHAARVREMLASYQALSRGRVRIRETDPLPFSEAEDQAISAGLQAIETESPDPLYFGIIGRNTVDDIKVIPFLNPERETMLEYDLTRMIWRLEQSEPARVGVLSTLPGMRSLTGEDGYAILQEIGRSYRLEQISHDFTNLPEMDVLVLAQPPVLTPSQEWQIDQFMLSRGRGLFMVDPAAWKGLSGGIFLDPATRVQSDLGQLGEAWGIEITGSAVADASHALTIPVEGPGGRIDQMMHPLFIAVPAHSMNREDPITGDLARQVNFGAPGAVRLSDRNGGLTATPLIRTGPAPALIDAGRARADTSPAEILASYAPQPGALTLALRISGQLRSAFPGGAPMAPMPEGGLSESEVPAEIIVIADTDFLSDEFYIVPGGGPVLADNGALVLNALDMLAGGGDLIRLRSRAPALRPMERIERMRQAAETRYLREQSLAEERLEEILARLSQLQEQAGSRGFHSDNRDPVLSEAEEAELASLREELPGLRSRLRTIEREYREGIDRTETILKALNIWTGPIIILLAGLIAWMRHRNRAEMAE